MEIKTGQLDHPEIRKLLEEHLADMNATSPPESVHALDVSSLQHESVTFWSGWREGKLLGCAAIKRLDDRHVEIKSMRTSCKARNQGVASFMLKHVLDFVYEEGFKRISLETGSMAFFTPARTLYEKFGFGYCEPFGDYTPDPNSQYMTLELRR
ncbi:GNAT family N-acetyltransferase [Vibrio sp. VPAP30]|uniref:GNAT family N-acetyltransferase n=1 Tax=Vibrio sp. VPAP30 TaxID=1647102 RepID=UPI00065807A1|nr:GNAT family N-acetyltransferase [Vibrio sp. VPAP30]KLN65076.1 acetyltransferase [Vibrio sp. VPAP30]